MSLAPALPSKVCAACSARYPSDALFCPTDGSPLQSPAAAERDSDERDPYLQQEIAGHIEIKQLVGVGAMGRVYRAFQKGIDRDVAVKILHRELSANAQLVSRFTRESKVASRLQHPNVVQVLLAGQLPDRALYMVMEYLDGLSLQGALSAVGGALSLNRALHITLQLCEAVGEAHTQGIVHRDLKPENVMLVRRGSDPDFVKVLDFGIARINWGEQSVATAAGLIFGTARYISPEGAQGNAVGPASDVYSIATLLYQMLSGRTPFDGDQAVGLLVQQIHDPAPMLKSIARAGYVPDPIAEVVMANLHKDPTKREPDARALGQAIFDAAKLAGLSPDEFSRPITTKRQPAAMQMPPTERTKQHELTPEIAEKIGASVSKTVEQGQRPPTAATVKWEPPAEFQTKLTEGVAATRKADAERASGVVQRPSTLESPQVPAAEGSRPRLSSVDETIDDMSLPAPSPSFPVTPPAPTPTPSTPRDIPRTMPGDPDAPVRTHYVPAIDHEKRVEGPPSAPIRAAYPSSPDRHSSHPHLVAAIDRPPRSRGLVLVFACFVLGAVIAGGWWKYGRSAGGDEERYVARATDAMFKNHFFDPPNENVKDITDDGLRKWPGDRRLLDIRVRAAAELTSQAIAQRAAGDVNEALKLARVAHELDPNDASTKRLVDQYENDQAGLAASAAAGAAPTLTKPPESPPRPLGSTRPAPSNASSSQQQASTAYKAIVDVSTASPRLGQTVDITARVTPPKGEFDQPGFTLVGPGVPNGVRMAGQPAGPGVFKASYAFLEGGKFEITFSTTNEGKAISAKRTLSAGGVPTIPGPLPGPAPAPAPAPAPPPAPAPQPSVKWM